MASATEPSAKKAGDETAKAFEQAYKLSHPNGPYPKVEPKRNGEPA